MVRSGAARARAVHAVVDAVGATSLGLGVGLTVAPRAFGRLLALDTVPGRARVLGVLDVALGAAILASGRAGPRRRWPALAGREALHVAIAGQYLTLGNRPAALAVGGLFVVDGVVTVLLYRQERRPSRGPDPCAGPGRERAPGR